MCSTHPHFNMLFVVHCIIYDLTWDWLKSLDRVNTSKCDTKEMWGRAFPPPVGSLPCSFFSGLVHSCTTGTVAPRFSPYVLCACSVSCLPPCDHHSVLHCSAQQGITSSVIFAAHTPALYSKLTAHVLSPNELNPSQQITPLVDW